MQNKQQTTDKNSSTIKNEAEDTRRNKVIEDQSESLKAKIANYKEIIRQRRKMVNVTIEIISVEWNKEIQQQETIVTGTFQQSPEDRLLLEHTSQNEDIELSLVNTKEAQDDNFITSD